MMNTLRDRTKAFALRVIRLYTALPKNEHYKNSMKRSIGFSY